MKHGLIRHARHFWANAAVFAAACGVASIAALGGFQSTIPIFIVLVLTFIGVAVWVLLSLGISRKRPTPLGKALFANLIVTGCLIEVFGGSGAAHPIFVYVLIAQIVVVEPIVVSVMAICMKSPKDRIYFEDI